MDQLHHYAAAALPAFVVVFMAGNLASIGLELEVWQTLAPFRDRRFILVVLAWNCLLCPAFAWLLAWMIPLSPSHALGLQLIGLSPAAPFLPMVVRRTGGLVP